MAGKADHRTPLTTLNAITATLRTSRTAIGGQGGASRLVGGTGLSCGPGGPHGATLRCLRPCGCRSLCRRRASCARATAAGSPSRALWRGLYDAVPCGTPSTPVLGPTRRSCHKSVFSLSVMRKHGMRGWRDRQGRAVPPIFTRDRLKKAAPRENRLPRSQALTGVRAVCAARLPG